MKRLISCYTRDFQNMQRSEFIQSIQASEGRTIVSETVYTTSTLLEEITNDDVKDSYGSDIILLNEYYVFTQFINGLEIEVENIIEYIKDLIGLLVAIN